MKRDSLLKVLGPVATFGGLAITLLSGWVNKKEQEKLIEEKVKEALAKHEN